MVKTMRILNSKLSLCVVFLTGLISVSLFADETPLQKSIGQQNFNSFSQITKKKMTDDELKQALEFAAAAPDLRFFTALMKNQKTAKSVLQKNSSVVLGVLTEQGVDRLKHVSKFVNLEQVRFEKGRTALHIATESSGLEIVSYLLKAHPKLVLVNDDMGESALFSAARRGEVERVQLLLKNKSLDKALKNKDGKTASQVALELDLPETSALLKAK